MKKGQDYKRLDESGLPIPQYGVFDDRCLSESIESRRLHEVVLRILDVGSGQIGVRTEPKESASPLANYPHIMPLTTLEEVQGAMRHVIREHPKNSWWFLVNEAFTEYEWNAVVMVTDQLLLPGGLRLTGEVNAQENLPLREALAISEHCLPVEKWQHPDSTWLRSAIIGSGIHNEWLEVSSVRARGKNRKIFWGMR